MANYYRAGAWATDDYTQIKTLHGRVSTSGNRATFRLAGQSSGYQVPTGKTFYATKVSIMDIGVQSDNTSVTLGYSDTDLGMNSSTAFTNAVSVIGDLAGASAAAAGGFVYNPVETSGGGQSREDFNYNGIFALCVASKYPAMRMMSSSPQGTSVIIQGFEV